MYSGCCFTMTTHGRAPNHSANAPPNALLKSNVVWLTGLSPLSIIDMKFIFLIGFFL